jgi:hypothetical protein
MTVQSDYDVSMPASQALANARFALWVKSVMDAARDRGLSDEQITAAIGFSVRTAYRWAANDIGPKGPTAKLVFQFCDGMGASRSKARTLLGWADDDDPGPSRPEPTAPPEFRELMRRLNDPNVPKGEKDHIRETLKDLIARRPKTGSAGKGRRAAE